MKKRAENSVKIIVRILETMTGLCALVMLSAIFWQVFTRFVIKSPAIWTEEIARYAFIYMAMFGAAVGVKKGSHFGMSLISDKLKDKAREVYAKYIVNGAILLCSLVITVVGWKFTIEYGLIRVSPTFLFPMAWVFASIPISGVFMTAFSLYNMIFEDYSKVITLDEELRESDHEASIT